MTLTSLHTFTCPRSNQPGCVAGQRVVVVRRFTVKARGDSDANASFHSPGSQREAGSRRDATGGAGGVLVLEEAAEVPGVQASDSREEPRRGESSQGGGKVTSGERVAVADPDSGVVLCWQVPMGWFQPMGEQA